MSARSLTFGDLVWSHFSRPRTDDLEGRLEASSAAGMAGLGLFAGEWARLRDEAGWALGRLVDAFVRHDQVLHDVEALAGWWAPVGPLRDRCAHTETLAYELADALGVRYLQAIGPETGSLDLGAAIDGFGSLCDRAAEHGLLVGIEWMPFTAIATSADARRVVEGADRPNGGYCVDVWHHRRCGDPDRALLDLDPSQVFVIQLSDGPPDAQEADLKRDCLLHRRPPGDGEFGLVEWLGMLRGAGVDAPISIEAPSIAGWRDPVVDVARRSAEGARSVLARLSR